ncbi:MAG: hypothetical protein RL417_916 [Pseudomonadota bacterium]|jgi:tetraacyldisaccharide 4'-kinase
MGGAKFLARLYGGATFLRNVGYDRGILPRYRAPLPVISIGNVTAGGNGKTPLAIFLVRELTLRGWRPVVVTRGYGGQVKGPHLVTAADTPRDVGDEPCLMAHNYGISVVVCRDRFEGARFAAGHELGDLVILDDGFQHRRLHRDLDIVSINVGTVEARAAFLKGELLPRGLFREDRSRALKRADIVVCAERRPDPGEPVSPEILAVLPGTVSVYRSFLKTPQVGALADRGQLLEPCAVGAFCGIANPEGFFSTLEGAGYTLAARRVFSDHHLFSDGDIAALRSDFPGLPLVCTEKDALKITTSREGIFVLGVETKVYPADALISQIDRKLRESFTRSA